MKKEKSSKAAQQVKRVMEKSEKQAALESALTQIEKAYGKGSVMKLGDGNTNMFVETIPTGSLGLDIALGVGGIPKGRIIEVYGPESSGKTTVALHMVAEAQKLGGIAAFIDAEHALDPAYAEKIGVNNEKDAGGIDFKEENIFEIRSISNSLKFMTERIEENEKLLKQNNNKLNTNLNRLVAVEKLLMERIRKKSRNWRFLRYWFAMKKILRKSA